MRPSLARRSSFNGINWKFDSTFSQLEYRIWLPRRRPRMFSSYSTISSVPPLRGWVPRTKDLLYILGEPSGRTFPKTNRWLNLSRSSVCVVCGGNWIAESWPGLAWRSNSQHNTRDFSGSPKVIRRLIELRVQNSQVDEEQKKRVYWDADWDSLISSHHFSVTDSSGV